MNLQTFSFTQIVSNIATAMQASATALVDYTVGSPLRAIAESTAGVVLWLQAIILQLLTLTRAATSGGADLDSFYADFNLPRLSASAATGSVTFSRFTPTAQAVIPVNQGVQTSDGTQKFFVTADATNAAYNSTLNGYILAAGIASVTVPVMAVGAGTQGNFQAHTLTQITSGIQYVDTASNGSGFINGIDAESDPAYRSRFVLYISSLSKATKAAVGYAITSTQQGLTYTITENTDYNGTADTGYASIILDDGSGYPSTALIARVSAAVDAVRPLNDRFGVFAPTVLTANVGMALSTAPGYVHNTVVAAVAVALQDFINALPLGAALPYTQLASVAYSIPGVVNASGITLNGSTADLTATVQNKILAGSTTIS